VILHTCSRPANKGNGKGKGEVVPVNVMEAYSANRGTALFIRGLRAILR